MSTDLEKAARYRRRAAELQEAAKLEIFPYRRRERLAMAEALIRQAAEIEAAASRGSGPCR
jgi:hypothetical protein